MLIRGETSYYLPLGYLVEQHRGLLVLRRPNGSVADTFDERQAIGEIVERRAWEDSIDRDGGRLERALERFLELPGPIVLGILWLLGIAPIGLCAVVLLHLRTLLLTVAGG
jgi:hypothetical protein